MTSLILEDKVTSDPEPGKVDKSKLQELYNKYKGIKADGYTAESWTAFAEARTEAETVLANEKATQEKVDKAAENLEKAFKSLKKEETKPDPDPTPGGNGGNVGSTAVVTGDSANIAGYLTVLLAAGGIAVVTFFRRKRVK